MRSLSILVGDSSQVSAARQAVHKLALDLEFDDERAGRAALVATEAVTNMVRHAGGGTFAARSLVHESAQGIEMLAIDSGPGMDDFERSARDGHSTRGTAGTGLGAIRRMSDEFEVSTERGEGTILRSVLWNRTPGTALALEGYEIGAVVVPKTGEAVSGDAWSMAVDGDALTLLVADGLGHGPDASRAASLAAAVPGDHPGESPHRLMERAHGKLRPTRGAAVAIVRRSAAAAHTIFAGIGHIGAWLLDGERRQALVSQAGIVGHNLHRIQEFRYEWPSGALLVLHSDGLDTRWDLARHPGIVRAHASVIAATLYRQHSRGRDDVVVLVAKAL